MVYNSSRFSPRTTNLGHTAHLKFGQISQECSTDVSHMLGLPVPAPAGEANGNAETATETEVSMPMSPCQSCQLEICI